EGGRVVHVAAARGFHGTVAALSRGEGKHLMVGRPYLDIEVDEDLQRDVVRQICGFEARKTDRNCRQVDLHDEVEGLTIRPKGPRVGGRGLLRRPEEPP